MSDQSSKQGAPAAQTVSLGNVMTGAPAANTNDSGGPAGAARRSARMGWIIVLVGFVGFVLWATFAPLAQGVPAPGKVVVEGQRQTVQTVVGGRIKAFHVRDGDTVAAGQVLAELDETPFEAARSSAFSQWVAARAEVDRLMAELLEADDITFDPSLLAFEDNAQVAQAKALQTQIMQSRQRVVQNETAAFKGNIAGLQRQIAAVERSLASRTREVALLEEQVAALGPLAAEGLVSRNRAAEQERALSQAEGALANMEGELGRLMASKAETELALTRRLDELRRESQQRLNEVRQIADRALAQLNAAQYELQNVAIRAPTDGVVVGNQVHTVGGVFQAGEKLMDLVPQARQLDIEAQVEVHMVDSVKVGLPVDLMFSALDLERTPVAQGEVTHVSADRLMDEVTRMPYFKVSVRLTEQGVQDLDGQTIRPGMPVDVFIKTGERSLMTYLLKPLLDRSAIALTEE